MYIFSISIKKSHQQFLSKFLNKTKSLHDLRMIWASAYVLGKQFKEICIYREIVPILQRRKKYLNILMHILTYILIYITVPVANDFEHHSFFVNVQRDISKPYVTRANALLCGEPCILWHLHPWAMPPKSQKHHPIAVITQIIPVCFQNAPWKPNSLWKPFAGSVAKNRGCVLRSQTLDVGAPFESGPDFHLSSLAGLWRLLLQGLPASAISPLPHTQPIGSGRHWLA